jgi:hypothetical protein
MMLDWALTYAARGWPVIPLFGVVDGRCACGAGACDSPGKHPHSGLAPHGKDDASTDTQTIAAGFDRVRNLNVGLRTGVTFDVLDLDSRSAGTWLACYAVVQGADTDECWRSGPMSYTGKGSHLLYAPTGAGNRTRVAGVAGFDWRGRDGYVVAPPSMHASGRRYLWAEGCGPDLPIPAAPDFLVALLDPPTPRRATTPVVEPLGSKSRRQRTRGNEFVSTRGGWSAAGLIATVATALEGERNNLLNWAAHEVGADVRDGRAQQADALDALDRLAVAAERSGLGTVEVERTIRSGYTAGLAGRVA